MKVDSIKYKMRAECQMDIGKFLSVVYVRSLSLATSVFPDVDVTFDSTMSLDQIRNGLRVVEDGHVMLETVELADKYTGERKPV